MGIFGFFKKNAMEYNNSGLLYDKKGNHKKAISEFTKSIEIDPNNSVPYINRALAYAKNGDYDKAIADNTKGIEIDPRSVHAYYARGFVHAKIGNYDKAIADYTKAIEINPKFADAYYKRSVAYASKKDERGREDLMTAARLGSSDAQEILRDHGVQWGDNEAKGIKFKGTVDLSQQLKQLMSDDEVRGINFKDTQMQGEKRYDIYTAPNQNAALAFLREHEVKERAVYVIVETPEGNFGRDLTVIFDEQAERTIEFGKRKRLPQPRKSATHCATCEYFVFPATLSSSTTYILSLEEFKEKGYGFKCASCGAILCAYCVTFKVEGQMPICDLCGTTMNIYKKA